jgi:hypothetical protein
LSLFGTSLSHSTYHKKVPVGSKPTVREVSLPLIGLRAGLFGVGVDLSYILLSINGFRQGNRTELKGTEGKGSAIDSARRTPCYCAPRETACQPTPKRMWELIFRNPERNKVTASSSVRLHRDLYFSLQRSLQEVICLREFPRKNRNLLILSFLRNQPKSN